MKNVPALLQADIDSGCTTLCYVLQIVSTGGDIVGLTSLDRTLDYDADDGLGEVAYLPDPGVDLSDMEAANDLSVDGGDGHFLLPVDALPLNAADIRRGVWDDALFKVLRLNYEAPDHGHYEVVSGQLGDVTLRDGALIVAQLDGNTRPLRQTICWRDSYTCRAIFGSQESEEIEYCGKDVDPLYVAFTVGSVTESDRLFTDPALTGDDALYVPGAVIWDTGANAGFFHGVDSFHTRGIVGLRTPTRYAIQPGDTGRIRVDCTKDVEGDKGCRDHFGDEWVNHFRGEPDIPMGGQAQVPGAEVGPGSGGLSTIIEAIEDA